jgi:spore germination protein KC
MVTMLDTPDCATVIPALKLDTPNHSHLVDGEMPENIFTPSGYAVFKDFKLVGYIEEEYARGYNFILGKAQSTAVSVKSPKSDTLVGVEVFSETLSPKLHWKGDKLTGVTYELCLFANISEQQAREDIYKVETLQDLSTKVSDVIKSDIQRVVEKSKELEFDCLGLGGQVKMRNPVRWHNMEKKWRDIFPALKIDVSVVTYIKRPLDIREPNGYTLEVS